MAKKQLPPRGPQLEIAGDLAVAFVNTAAARDVNRQQGVGSYPDLLTWSQQVSILQAHDAERLAAKAAEDPAAAQVAFAGADKTRRALMRLFIAMQLEKALPPGELEIFNRALGKMLPAARVVPCEQGLAWGFAGDDGALDRMLWPVLFAAAELLISAKGRPHVRQCGAKDCRLFFVDRTPSRQRRWCEMKTCGNRAKSLRHYHRSGKAQREDYNRKAGLWRRKRPRATQQDGDPPRGPNRNVV